MALQNLIKKRMLVLIGLVLVAALIIALVWSSNTVETAEQAVRDSDNDLVLTPVYELNGRALFFFIRDDDQFGAATAIESWFGWRLETRTESTIPTLDDPDRINNYASHEDGFVYGLFDPTDGRHVQIGEMPADQLLLGERFPAELLEETGLSKKAVWFTENAPEDRPLPLQLLDADGQELQRLDMY
ncbi:hypothetical protein [Planococcus maritimus]|uniref:hypothetical protein n=1 Tax=Planococcus maritimus TaxID=192421 RepID=UPI002330AC79|nr:hypothetical protein [Planococcus maritimus]